MGAKGHSCLLLSDFNINNLAGYLNNDNALPQVRTAVTPFGQVLPLLVDENSECWQSNHDFAVIWTQPHSVIPSFNDILKYKTMPLDKILHEVDKFSAAVLNIKDRVDFTFSPTWAIPSYHRGFGILDMKTGLGIANTLMHMNLRLAENLSKTSNCYVLNSQKWVEHAGQDAFNPKLWYMGKIAFGNEVFKEAVHDIKAALNAIRGNTKKLIITDLDDTLWGGIVGDLGWQNLKLGGHDHIGEAYVDFQRALKNLKNRGILLGIVSKNEETVALEAINQHPEMVLREADFVGWKINWRDKAKNIVDFVADLNLGLQSVVFIDDNPIERARVREALPEVLVPEWPQDKVLYASSLLRLRCFDSSSMTSEDLSRTRMYSSERQRNKLRKNVGSLDEWLNTLGIKVAVEELHQSNVQRAAQLLNKTNQMNLSTRRMTESGLLQWAGQENHKLWTFRVSDRFGDSGLTGLISIEMGWSRARVVDFILSCRVMGRRIEESMLYTAITYASSIGLEEIEAKYIPTPKNKPCLYFFDDSGFVRNGENGDFTYKLKNKYKLPECIQMENY